MLDEDNDLNEGKKSIKKMKKGRDMENELFKSYIVGNEKTVGKHSRWKEKHPTNKKYTLMIFVFVFFYLNLKNVVSEEKKYLNLEKKNWERK
jgi:hypothetical protein